MLSHVINNRILLIMSFSHQFYLAVFTRVTASLMFLLWRWITHALKIELIKLLNIICNVANVHNKN